MVQSLGFAYPGESVSHTIDAKLQERADAFLAEASIKLGPGLVQLDQDIMPLKCGTLLYHPPNRFWVEHRQQRYVPAAGDLVIAIVVAKLSEGYRVDLGSSSTGYLPLSSFEGATKKNRPNLQVGSAVFCRVALSSPDMEPELACVDREGKEAGFGELSEGQLIRVSCSWSQALQRLSFAPLLDQLGKHLAFELAAGANGRVVINAASVKETLLLAHLLSAADGLDQAQQQTLLKDFLPRLK